MNIHGMAWALRGAAGRRPAAGMVLRLGICLCPGEKRVDICGSYLRNNMMPLGSEKQIFSRYLAGKVLPCCHDDDSGFIIIDSSEQRVDVGQVGDTRCVA